MNHLKDTFWWNQLGSGAMVAKHLVRSIGIGRLCFVDTLLHQVDHEEIT
jgi:hypothetical protein